MHEPRPEHAHPHTPFRCTALASASPGVPKKSANVAFAAFVARLCRLHQSRQILIRASHLESGSKGTQQSPQIPQVPRYDTGPRHPHPHLRPLGNRAAGSTGIHLLCRIQGLRFRGIDFRETHQQTKTPFPGYDLAHFICRAAGYMLRIANRDVLRALTHPEKWVTKRHGP